MRNLSDYLIGAIPVILVGLLGLLFVAGIFAAIEDAKRWAEFKVTHECKIVGRMSGDTLFSNTFDAKGNVGIAVTQTPDKTGWACNDGVTYWR